MFIPPKESREYPGFYEIVGYPGFVISKEGLVINCYQHRFVPRFYQPNGYVKVHIGHGRKDGKFIAIHLLVARTFLPKPSEDPTLQVNHIDGDKYNPRLSNLEWVTPQENDWHAGRTGLTIKCIPIQVRDNNTGSIQEFPSCREYAKAINVPYDQVRYMLKFGDNGKRIYENGIQIRKVSTNPWPVNSYSYPLDKSMKVDVRDLMTGKEYTVESITDLMKLVNHDSHTLRKHLIEHLQPVYENCLQIKLASDPEWRQPGDLILEICNTIGTKAVQMYNPLTGESRVFGCKKSCERLTGISANQLINLLRTKPGHIRRYNKGLKYEYGYYPIHDDMSLPVEKLEW